MQTDEPTQYELEILKALAHGEAEIEAGVGHESADVFSEADKVLSGA